MRCKFTTFQIYRFHTFCIYAPLQTQGKTGWPSLNFFSRPKPEMFATISRPSQVINFTTTPRPYFSPFYLTYLKISLYFFPGLRIRPPSPRLWFYNMEFMQRCGQFLLFTAICIIIIEFNDSYVAIYSKYKFVLTYILGIRG